MDSYAGACDDISLQRNQRTRANNSSRRGPTDVSCQLCSQNHSLGRRPEYLVELMSDRQGCVRRLSLCPNCPRAYEKGLCRSKTRCHADTSNGFYHSTLHRTEARQQQQKKTTKWELDSNLTIQYLQKLNEPKPDVTSVMKTKGSKRVQATTYRMEFTTNQVDLTAFHTVSTGIEMVFTISR